MVALLDVLDAMVRPEEGTFSREHADYVLSLDLPEAVKDRCDVLSAKAQEGTLTADEAAELDHYISVDAMLTVLKSKARRSLAAASALRDRRS
jgi:hypothetical protein